jgi:membrane protein YqaA with SNARE-associated domain
MGIVIAGVWGLAEAILFFLVPDVWLTRLAITRSYRYSIKACLAAVSGALLGGVVMVVWSGLDAGTAQGLVLSLPAISESMAGEVQRQLASGNPLVLLHGAFSGIPYKLYAVYVTESDIPLWLFLLAAAPARLVRFVLTVTLAHWLARLLEPYLGRKLLLRLWGGFWVLFYCAFWWVMPW